MICAGLDVGSRTIKLVLLNEGAVESAVVPTGVNPLSRCRELLDGKPYGRLVLTGYGRHLVSPHLGGTAVSEIKAYAAGARRLYPDCRTVIDVGGQDTKVIHLSPAGQVQKFEMNDRCAAGTGRFLEVMANTLEIGIEHLGETALAASGSVQVNSMCTVFAESEVVSMIGRGEDVGAIALALHEAIATRIASMVRRVGIVERVVFAGGGALNPCLRGLLSRKLDVEIAAPADPRIVGAFGSALLAEDS